MEGVNEDSATLFGPFVHGGPFCSSYENSMQLFLNSQKKRSIELIAKHNVAELKRPKRKKT